MYEHSLITEEKANSINKRYTIKYGDIAFSRRVADVGRGSSSDRNRIVVGLCRQIVAY